MLDFLAGGILQNLLLLAIAWLIYCIWSDIRMPWYRTHDDFIYAQKIKLAESYGFRVADVSSSYPEKRGRDITLTRKLVKEGKKDHHGAALWLRLTRDNQWHLERVCSGANDLFKHIGSGTDFDFSDRLDDILEDLLEAASWPVPSRCPIDSARRRAEMLDIG